MPLKTFTVEEASRLIPVISAIFDKITSIRVKMGLIRESVDYAGVAKPDFQESPQKLAERMKALTEEVKKHAAEVQAYGCILKDLDNYLVDFSSIVDGKPAFLCWRYGEDQIKYWHGQESGYTGRIPLTAIRQETK